MMIADDHRITTVPSGALTSIRVVIAPRSGRDDDGRTWVTSRSTA
jgi:hypothetical protein